MSLQITNQADYALRAMLYLARLVWGSENECHRVSLLKR